MFDGTLRFDTSIDKSGFEGGLAALGSLAKKGLSLVTSLGGKAVEVGKEFEAGVSQIAATLGYSSESLNKPFEDMTSAEREAYSNMEALSDKAEEMGAATSFSAAQAAEGLNILAMSGYSAEDSISMIESVLNLAAAGSISLSDAASFAAGSMKGFAVEAASFADAGKASAYYADVIAKGATLAATDVYAFGEALSQASSSATAYGQSSTEAGVALLRLAEQNVTGSAAATALAAAMKNLYSPTNTASQALESLGVSAYDSSGKAREFNTVVDELDAALSTLSDQDRASLEDAIFGIQGKNAFDQMVVSSSDKVQSFYDGIASASGSAALQAETMLDNLEGDLTILESAASGLGIKVYKAINDPLRDLAKSGTDYITQLTEALSNGGFEGFAETFGDVLSQAVGKISEYVPKIASLGASVTASFANGIVSNIGTIADTASQVLVILTEAVSVLVPSLIEGFGEAVPDLAKAAINAVSGMAEALIDSIPTLLEAGITLVQSLADTVVGSVPLLLDAASSIVSQLADTVKNSLPMLAEAASQLFEGITAELPSLIGTVLETVSQLLSSVTDLLPFVVDAGLTLLQGLISGILDNAPLLLDAAVSLANQLVDVIADSLPMLIDAALQLVDELADFLVKSAPMLLSAAVKLFSGLVDAIPRVVSALTAALPKIIDTVIGLIPQIAEALTNAVPLIIDAVTESIPVIIDAAAEALPALITGITEALASSAPQLIDGAIQLFSALVDALPVVLCSLLEQLPTVITAIVDTLIQAAPVLAEASVTLLSELVKALPQIIAQIAEGLAALAQTIFSWLGDIFSEAWVAISTWFSESVGNARRSASEFISAITEFISELPRKVADWLTSALVHVIKWADDMSAKAKEAAQSFLSNVRESISRIPQTAKDWLDRTISRVAEWAVSLKNKGKTAAKDLVSSVVSGIASLPQKMADAGLNLVRGLWNGITGAGNWLREKISDFGHSIINGFKSAFGIASPSRVMRDEVGQYLASGIGVGFTQNIPDIADEAKKKLTDISLPGLNLIATVETEANVPDLGKKVSAISYRLPEADRSIGMPTGTVNPDIQPPAASQVFNSYSYQTTYASSLQTPQTPQEITLNAQFVVGEEIASEGVLHLLSDRLDEKQGLRVQLRRRGLAT